MKTSAPISLLLLLLLVPIPALTQPDTAAVPDTTVTEPATDTDTATEPATATATDPDTATEPATDPDTATATEPATATATATDQGTSTGAASFMDVRLNLTLTNENVFAKPGETIPSVPGWRFGRPSSLGVLFFENYDTRFSGYETLSHAVLYKRHDDKNWEVEGAFVLRLNNLAQDRIDFSDAGSYIRVAHWFDETRKNPARVSLVAFPTSSDRFRLGYSYRLSWGGSTEYQRSRQAVPGIKAQYDGEQTYAFIGAKSAVVLDSATSEEKAVMAFLAGAGIDVTDMLRVEVNGGYFNRGSNELQDVLTEDVILYGASTQIAFHKDMPVGSSIDYKLYRNDPERAERWFAPAVYPGGLSWMVAGEATLLGQTLKDPNVSGGTTTQYSVAGDINARVKYNRTRFRGDLQYRDLGFVLHSTPSLPTYSDFPDAYQLSPNLFAAVGVDHNIESSGLTLGLVLGMDMPATLKTPTGVIPGDTVGGSGESTAVIRNEGDITVLPEGEDVLPQFAAKGTVRLDFAKYFAALGDVYYSYDPNQTRLIRDGPEDLLRREFGQSDQLGFNVTLQAKF